ncbi:hypothetical protein O6H91_13G041900 [Diphasiastrum complanatum]|uniref:Uncharacterized protein n=1 Tax=Diphasiastrum complanatum TaxID=34168 RepID=A0ACC2BU69_DIPCM|nr:hypothetical protein O6H91_13G041900 [Diphasiastrum complanatum]
MTLRHMLGEDLLALNLTEMEELEQQIGVALNRIRLRKDEVLLRQINDLSKKGSILMRENQMLHSMIAAENEMTGSMLDMETREPSSVENGDAESLSLQLDHQTSTNSNSDHLQTFLRLGPYQPDLPIETPGLK